MLKRKILVFYLSLLFSTALSRSLSLFFSYRHLGTFFNPPSSRECWESTAQFRNDGFYMFVRRKLFDTCCGCWYWCFYLVFSWHQFVCSSVTCAFVKYQRQKKIKQQKNKKKNKKRSAEWIGWKLAKVVELGRKCWILLK